MNQTPIFYDKNGLFLSGTEFKAAGRSFPLTHIKNLEVQPSGFWKRKVIVDNWKDRIEVGEISRFQEGEFKTAIREAISFYMATQSRAAKHQRR